MAATDENEILEIHERHQHRARWVWETAKPWFRRAVGVAVTIAAWVWILDPLADHWHRVRGVFWSISIWRFALATVLLAGTLALFRAMAWRHVLLAAGVSVPAIATLRIWSTIELSRYVPGGFFPLAGRINLTRPYGIDALLCTVTHAVELAVFFLANILVAVGGLVWFAASVLQPHGMILYAALALLPALLLVLHPRVFYRLLGWIMRGMGLPPIEHRLPGTELLGLLGWMMLGVLAQLAAIWLLLGQGDTFDLGPRHIPLVAAAYALGWCVGTIAIWVPAGIGLQELVYVNVLLLAPLGFLGQAFNNSMTYFAMLALMSILLRVWSTAGDLLISAAAFAIEVIHGGPDDFDASAHNPPPPATMTSSR